MRWNFQMQNPILNRYQLRRYRLNLCPYLNRFLLRWNWSHQ
jgi:hypothetical protein